MKIIINKQRIFFILLILPLLFLLSACQKKDKSLESTKDNENIENQTMIRKPAVSGSFYPSSPDNLKDQINAFLSQTKVLDEQNQPQILILPHAGIDYSGQTAAWGFKQIKGKNIKRVILLGSSHRQYFSKAAIYNKGAWETPLGKVEIDENLADKLIASSYLIEANPNPHLEEHSLEIQIPFLQLVLTDFKIVPILLSQADEKTISKLTETISQNLDNKTILLISSDLSHYPDQKTAKKVDQETINSILTGRAENFEKVISKNISLPGVETCACADKAIKIGLLTANNLEIKNIKLINYSTSADYGGDIKKTVGYASIAFYPIQNQPKTINVNLNKDSQNKLLQIARSTLEQYLKDKTIPQIEITDESLNQNLGAFVTLKKNQKLRGCIGEFEPQKKLYKTIQEKAIDAGLNDPRFPPITLAELKDINIEISVLSPNKKIENYQLIELKKHGVVIKKGNKGGTFLPQVAQETNWDLETFLENLCQSKAGLPKDCYKDPETQIYTFTAQVFEE